MTAIDIGLPMISRDSKYLPSVIGNIQKSLVNAGIHDSARMHVITQESDRHLCDRVKELCTSTDVICSEVPDYDLKRRRHQMSKIAQKRNAVVQRARDDGRSGVLFVDSDILLNRDTVRKLLAACDDGKDVCAAAYHPTWSADPVVAVGTPEEYALKSTYELGADSGQRCVPMVASGTGCTLFKASSFDVQFENMHDERTGIHGEDIGFMINANKKGLRMCVLPSYHVTHLAASHNLIHPPRAVQ